MMLRWLAALLVTATIAAGCSTGTEDVSKVPQTSAPAPRRESSATTTTTTATTAAPTGAAFTGSVEELRARLVEHGLCDQLTTFVPLLPVTVTGLQNCEDGYLLITLPTQFERDAVILGVADNPCTDTTYLAADETWIVIPVPSTEVRAAQVVDILGGEVRAVPCERD
jgi:hypothetical protein